MLQFDDMSHWRNNVCVMKEKERVFLCVRMGNQNVKLCNLFLHTFLRLISVFLTFTLQNVNLFNNDQFCTRYVHFATI